MGRTGTGGAAVVGLHTDNVLIRFIDGEWREIGARASA
jgi:hypothetical protein